MVCRIKDLKYERATDSEMQQKQQALKHLGS